MTEEKILTIIIIFFMSIIIHDLKIEVIRNMASVVVCIKITVFT